MTSLAYAALWIFVFVLPWELALGVVGGIGVISKLTGGLALGLAMISVVISGRFRRWHFLHVAALLFVLWVGFGLLVMHQPGGIPKKFYTYVQLLLMIWMIWVLATSWQRQLGLMTAYVLGAYVAAIDTILLYRSQAGILRRFSAGGADANDLAMTLALGLPIAWYLGMTYRRPLLRWVGRGYLPVGLLAIGLTGSRGGMIATTVALLIVPLTMTRLSPTRLAAAILVLGISGAVAVAYVPETLIERLMTTRREVDGGRLGGRGKLWEAGIHAFFRKPLMGYGPAGFIKAITPELGQASQVAHNSFLSVLVEHGTVGLILYLMMFVAVFRAIRPLPPLERRFALVLMAALGVAMLPLTWEDRKVVWFILAALLGLAKTLPTTVEGTWWQSLPQPSTMAGTPASVRARKPVTTAARNPRSDPTA